MLSLLDVFLIVLNIYESMLVALLIKYYIHYFNSSTLYSKELCIDHQGVNLVTKSIEQYINPRPT